MITLDKYSKALVDVAALQERERIIKLLETSCGQNDCNCEIRISHAIALIKGENK